MYSPKISEDLIPVLYKIGKEENIPMTRLVDRFLRDSISKYVGYSDSRRMDGLEKDYNGDDD